MAIALSHSEQQEVDTLKHLWTRGGWMVALAIMLVIAGYGIYWGWGQYQAKRTQHMATLFTAVEAAYNDQISLAANAARSNQATKRDEVYGALERAVAALVNEQSRHALTLRAQLLLAKAAFDQNDLAGAQRILDAAYTHSADDAELNDVIALRLAAVLADQKQWEPALSYLQIPKQGSARGPFAELRGDLLVLKGDFVAAQQAYQEAGSLAGQAQEQSQGIPSVNPVVIAGKQAALASARP